MFSPESQSFTIVRIIARLNVGGPARHVVWLTKAFQNENSRSILLTGTVPPGEEDMNYFAEQHKVQPVFIPEMSRELSPKDFISLWKVFKQLRNEKPNIIHTHTAKAGTIGRVAGLLYKILTFDDVKIVHTYHGHVFHSYYGNLKTKFFLAIEKTLARISTDKIIVISQQQYEEIHKKFGIGKASQFKVVPLGIDLDIFQNQSQKRHILREELKADESEVLVGLVGRLTEIKNHELFLQVAKIYKSKKTDDFPQLRFVIIGDGHLRESLEKKVKELEIADIVRFLGNRNDTDVFYAGLDIVALTSLNEGTPLSIIEAMANEKPSISTKVGGVVDLMGDVQNERQNYSIHERGITVTSGDAKGFYNGLIFLANDKNLRDKISAKGKDFISSNYSKERLIADLRSLYSEIIKKKD